MRQMMRVVDVGKRVWMISFFLLSLFVRTNAEETTFTFGKLTVTTEGVEGTDYDISSDVFKILTGTEFSFTTNGETHTNRIHVCDDVQGATINLNGVKIDVGYTWGGDAMYIGKNSTVTVALGESTENYFRGGYEFSSVSINQGASLTVTGDGSMTVESGHPQGAGHGAAIQVVATAQLIVNKGTLTAITAAHSSGAGAAIGSAQYYGEGGACGTVIINGGVVNAISNDASAAAIGGGSGCSYGNMDRSGHPGGTVIVNGGTLNATGRIGGGLNKYGTIDGSGGTLLINGGAVTSTIDFGSGPNATEAGLLNMVGGTLSTPSIDVADGTVTFKQSVTLRDNYDFINYVLKTANAEVVVEANGVELKAKSIEEGSNITGDQIIRTIPSLVDGYYQITTVDQLCWFRDLVNGSLADGTAQNISANAILLADLDLSNIVWTPIGNYDPWYNGGHKYQGTFDGNYHTISNLRVAGSYDHGFFGRVDNGQVKNLGIINANIGSSEGYLGVIAGAYIYSKPMLNCYAVGDITFSTSKLAIGGITGVTEWSGIKNCHTSYGNIIGQVKVSSGSEGCAFSIDPLSYKTGELAYLLNTANDYAGTIDGMTSWGQKIGEDAHPVALSGDNQVYKQDVTHEESVLNVSYDYSSQLTTLCYPKSVQLPDRVKAFTATATQNNLVRLKALDSNLLPANTPALLINLSGSGVAITLPAVNGYYTNSEASLMVSDISQDGNLLHGTYEAKALSTDKEYGFTQTYEGVKFSASTSSVSAFSAYLCVENSEQTTYYLSSETPFVDIAYQVLSAEDQTVCISSIHAIGSGDADNSIHIPSEVVVDGKMMKVTRLGTGETIDHKNYHNYGNPTNGMISLYFPKTLSCISSFAVDGLCGEMMMMESAPFSMHFSTEEPAAVIGYENYLYISSRNPCYVPYGAENRYAAAWHIGTSAITSRHTDLDLANGIIIVDGSTYTQNGTTDKIDETLVVTGTTTNNNLILFGGTEDAPLRVAIKDVTADLEERRDSKNSSPIDVKAGACVDLIVLGTNILRGGYDSAGLHVTPAKKDGSQEAGTLNICQLSSGTMECYGGSVNGGGSSTGTGIGGHESENFGNIIINGGTITATGYKGSSGLGGASYAMNMTDYKAGDIIINGGNVTAIYNGDRTSTAASVGAAVGSIDETFTFFVSDQATFIGTVNANTNVTVAATVYNGNDEAMKTELHTGDLLATNALAYARIPIAGIDNMIVDGRCEQLVLHDAVNFHVPSAFTATHLTYHRTFVDNDFNALYLPFGAKVSDFIDCEIYAINMFHQTDEDNDGVFDACTLEVMKAQDNQKLLPNHPYIFKYKGQVESILGKEVSFNLSDVDVVPTESPVFTCSSMNFSYTFQGIYQQLSPSEAIFAIGLDDHGQTAIVHPTSAVAAQRWVMTMTEREAQFEAVSPSSMKRIAIVVKGEENTSTGIREFNTATDVSTFYDLSGRPTNSLRKGLNVVKTTDGRVVKMLKR